MKITIEGTEEEIRRALERIGQPKEIVEPARIPAPFRVEPLPAAPVWITPHGLRDLQIKEMRVGDVVPDPYTITCEAPS